MIGGRVITSSSLEDVCSSEVSDMRDLFDFFDLLFIGFDESEPELEPFLFFLFDWIVSVQLSGIPGTGLLGVGSVFLGTGSWILGAGFCDVFCLSELLLEPVVLLTVAFIASQCFCTSVSSRDPLPLHLSMVRRAPAILFSRS